MIDLKKAKGVMIIFHLSVGQEIDWPVSRPSGVHSISSSLLMFYISEPLSLMVTELSSMVVFWSTAGLVLKNYLNI